jgi:hypothetical protein
LWSSRACLTPGPPLVPRRRGLLHEDVRDVWTLRGVLSNVTAAIWRNDFGLELRVENNGEFTESRFPLTLIADQIKANLIEKGWTEPPNAT